MELQIPHVLSIIDTRDAWFYSVHPERMVPALKDRDAESGEDVVVFEGTACLQYLAEKWDKDGGWKGRTDAEKGAVLSWTAYQTAGIGYACHLHTTRLKLLIYLISATAKYWLYFSKGYPTRENPEPLPRTIEKYPYTLPIHPSHLTTFRLHSNTLMQWDILEKRLSIPGQHYIALQDRPTLADLSYFPFSMPWMFKFLGVDVNDWPHIAAWGQKMLSRPAIVDVMDRAPKLGN